MQAMILKEAQEYLKFPSNTFKLAFTKALNALLADAKDSSYVPSPGNEDAYDYLTAVIDDMKIEASITDEDPDDILPIDIIEVVDPDDDDVDPSDFNFNDEPEGTSEV